MRRSSVLLTSLALVVALVSGCSAITGKDLSKEPNGIEKSDPVTSFKDAVNATRTENTIVVTGNLPVNGKGAAVDLRFDKETAHATVNGKTFDFEVVRVGNQIGVKADPASWAALADVAISEKDAQKFVVGPADDRLGTFNYFTNVGSFFRASPRLTKQGLEDLDGRQVLKLYDPGTKSTWWVSATGTPLIRKFSDSTGKSLVFDYDTDVLVTPLPTGDTVPVGSLKAR